MTEADDPTPFRPPRPPGAPPRRRSLDAEVLFRDGPEIEIHHREEIYRLRLTRGGKLILTK
ncbi:hemin uptake protein HemP [Sediminicoccus sp. BL-A-41-H5]|uniref:hemin uptake protein HemP n=1 Tax=Sediminicoccus sp. BL-A-41-H5 TaxID=3421106 RepID=UPI003D67D119